MSGLADDDVSDSSDPKDARNGNHVSGAGKRALRSIASVGRKTATAVTAEDASARATVKGVAKTGNAAANVAASGVKAVWGMAGDRGAQIMSAAQALLASDISGMVNDLVAAAVKGAPTIYDKAMDANYLDPVLRSELGGARHRLFDGGHSLVGAVKATHAASTDDTLIQEAVGTVQGLLRDVSTPMGLPLATWDKGAFDAASKALQSKFGLPASWLYELNTFDVADLLGGAAGVVSVIFGWNSADTESFAHLAASMTLSASMSINPLLLLVSVVALARAFHKARNVDDYAALMDGGVKGIISSGASMAAVAAIGAAGGPGGVALLAGILAGVLVHAATKNVTVADINRFVTDRAMSGAGIITDQADKAMRLAADRTSTVGRRVAGQTATAAATVKTIARRERDSKDAEDE